MNGTPKPGEWWRLREGKRALIYAVHQQNYLPIHGAVLLRDGSFGVWAWALDGTSPFGTEGTTLDSRIDWRDELAPIWWALQPEFKWIARDKDGEWWAYKEKPERGDEEWIPGSKTTPIIGFVILAHACQWDETLTERPEGA